MEKYHCNGICENCEKGKHYHDKNGDYYTCDSEKVRDLEVIPPLPRWVVKNMEETIC